VSLANSSKILFRFRLGQVLAVRKIDSPCLSSPGGR
jgi:hypothetical protein